MNVVGGDMVEVRSKLVNASYLNYLLVSYACNS